MYSIRKESFIFGIFLRQHIKQKLVNISNNLVINSIIPSTSEADVLKNECFSLLNIRDSSEVISQLLFPILVSDTLYHL